MSTVAKRRARSSASFLALFEKPLAEEMGEAIDIVRQAWGVKLELRSLLKAMIDNNASDLHITCGTPPRLRVDGRIAA